MDLLIYLDRQGEAAIRGALSELASEGVVTGELEVLKDLDWSEAWKEGLESLIISPRLVVRPSFVAHDLLPGQQEVIVDPGQAFGTGGHESTRLILDWLDGLLDGAEPPRRVLDVGTGSGVLALAALKLGAHSALGFDLDRGAVREAGEVSRVNGLGDKLSLFAGPIQALAVGGFDLVLVNLLRSEMLPIAKEIVGTLSGDGRLVLSGLLESDREEVLAAFAEEGLSPLAEGARRDASGAQWISPLLGFSG
ncbi:MAG: 50S ribosomal protein L11 methyltransferase [Myxococcota bacterium]|nr:50S ribosomal protein L11 methyltransferase [Myxococcota bacterium]